MMQTFRLYHRDQSLLYESTCRSLRECVEEAVRNSVTLDGVNLAYADLSEIDLDGAHLHDASFESANLTGANISEASLKGCNFRKSALFNACFCHSDLNASDFSDAEFGATDLAGAGLENCIFSGPSILKINLSDCESLSGSIYKTDWNSCPMSRPPLVIAGLDVPVSVFDRHVLIGQNLFNSESFIWKMESPLPGLHPLPERLIKIVSLLQSLRETGTQSCSNITRSTYR
jgi:hypothetical protein